MAETSTAVDNDPDDPFSLINTKKLNCDARYDDQPVSDAASSSENPDAEEFAMTQTPQKVNSFNSSRRVNNWQNIDTKLVRTA